MEHQHTGLPIRPQEEKRLLGIDPVCGMRGFEKPDVPQRTYKGTTYY